MKRFLILAAGCALLAGLACTQNRESSDPGATGIAELAGPDGAAMGTVTLTQGPWGVLVQAEVTGLTPGAHGFHVHEIGACIPDFSAAGGHFDPVGLGHGLLHDGGAHAGDLPNIHAAADGTARADYFTDALTLDDGADHSVFDEDGSAIIVHAGPDSYGEDPGAGDRVACGVIRRS